MKNLDARLTCPGGIFAAPHCKAFSLVLDDGTNWDFDVAEEFLAEYRPGLYATYTRTCDQTGVELRLINYTDNSHLYTRLILQAPDKATAQAISNIIDQQPCLYFPPPRTKRRACRPPTRGTPGPTAGNGAQGRAKATAV